MDEELLQKLDYILMNLRAERGGKDAKTALREMRGEVDMPEWADKLNAKAKEDVDSANLGALEKLYIGKMRNQSVWGSELPTNDPLFDAGQEIHGSEYGAGLEDLSPEEVQYYSNMGRKYRESENQSIDKWNDSLLGYLIPRVRR
jgi:hypothetical protein